MTINRAFATVLGSLFALSGAHAQDVRAGFVTTLGRDTVALESFTRSPSRLEGDLLVRVPGTVLFHYRLDLRANGTVSRSTVDMNPLGVSRFEARKVTTDFLKDSARITVEELGERRQKTAPIDSRTVPYFMTGFESSYGLYSSLGVTELLVSGMKVSATDTLSVPAIGIFNSVQTKKKLMRRSATTADIDYFLIAYTRMTTNEMGQILTVDMSATTEKTQSARTEFINVKGYAQKYAERDRAGAGLGVASPNEQVRAKVGSTAVAVQFGSPRRRGREILGNVVVFDRAWRTGANEATVLTIDKDITIGGAAIPAGTYSLWTLPTRTGVQLIINRESGQWGTSYDVKKDLVRVTMQTATAAAPQENFSVKIVPGGSNAGTLQIAWDTFVWSVPLVVK